MMKVVSNYLKAVSIGAAIIAAGTVPGGETAALVDGEEPVAVKCWNAVQNTEFAHSGKASMEIQRGKQVISPDFIEIDPTKTYTLSGFFRTIESTPDNASINSKNRVLIYVYYYDKNKTLMGPCSMWPMIGTENTLKKAVKKGDSLKERVPDEWYMHPRLLYAMAFDVKDDLSDLPNASAQLLGKPAQADHPAGTRIRLHRYIDPAQIHGAVVPIWTLFTITLSGEAPIDNPNRRIDGNKQFWNGTKYVKIRIINRDHSGGDILCDDLVLEEIPEHAVE